MSMTAKEKVQSLLTAANAATGKTAADLTEAVGDLIDGQGSGEVDALKFVKTTANNMFKGADFGEQHYSRFVFDLRNSTSGNLESFLSEATINADIVEFYINRSTTLYAFANRLKGCKKLVLHLGASPTSLSSALRPESDCEEIEILGSLSLVTAWNQTLWLTAPVVKRVTGDPCDMSSVTVMDSALASEVLESIRFVPNTLHTGGWNPAPRLDVESNISLANAFAKGESKSMTVSANQKTIFNTTFGYVNDDGLFVADESGTMTLMDFIVNEKGWTIA